MRRAVRRTSDHGDVPLTLVTGPANAAKAGEVLGGLRARVDDEPILVVPAFQDVEHAQRELAEPGRGVRRERPALRLAVPRDRAPHRSLRAHRVRRPARADRRGGGAPGPAGAAGRVRRPARLRAGRRALRGRAGALDGRAGPVHPGAAGVGRRRSAAPLRRRDRRRSTAATAPVSTRRASPTPSCSRGTASTRCASTPRAGAGRRCSSTASTTSTRSSSTRSTRSPTGAGWTWSRRCPSSAAAPPSRASPPCTRSCSSSVPARTSCLRSTTTTRPSRGPPCITWSAACSRTTSSAVEAGSAVEFHSAAGQRAEIELAGARLLDLLREGVEPGDVAVVLRRPDDYASLLEQVFGAYDIPFSIDRSVPALAHRARSRAAGAGALRRGSRRGRRGPAGLAAHARAAAPARAGRPARGHRAPRRGPQRRRGARSLGERALEARRPRPAARSRVGAPPSWSSWSASWSACSRPPTAARPPSCAVPSSTTRACSWRPATRSPSCAPWSRRTLARGSSPSACWPCCASCGCTSASRRSRTASRSPSPRRSAPAASHAVFVCGLEEGEFPAGARPEPFLPDEDRRAIATASGLLLPVREDRLDRERYLFYLCCSRAERLLVLSSRSSDEEGNPQSESFFVEDVRDLLVPGAAESTRSPVRRDLASRAGAHGRRAGARARGDRSAPQRGTARPPDRRGGAGAAGRARRRLGQRARELRRLPGEVARAERAATRRAGPRPRADGARALRPRRAAGARSRACARRPATAGSRPPTSAQAERLLLEELRDQAVRVPAVAEADAREGRGAPARVRPGALPAPRGRSRRRLRARAPGAARSGSTKPASRWRSRPA